LSPAEASPDRVSPGRRPPAWPVFALCLAILLVMAVMGMFRGLGDTLAWTAEFMAGAAIGLTAARWLVPHDWRRGRLLWAAILLIAVSIAAPMELLVFAIRVLMDRRPATLALAVAIAPPVFAVSVIMTALAFLVRRPPQADPGPAAVPTDGAEAAAKFVERLSPRLKGADLYAVEAEDHYLRLHTSLGQDLVLMRLGDAVAELARIEGAQTHRSWWVARAAVDAAERFDGRATLILKDGARAPVSRGFARSLRDAGWF
jgi:branched-subunit amino acid ABC-type transport system permease component